MLKFFVAQIFVALISSSAFAATCDIEPTSDGKFGVRELRTSGWIYLVRNLTYEQAAKALNRLQAQGRCD